MRRAFLPIVLSLAWPALLSAQTDTLRLLFAGDIMGHTPQIRSAELVPDKAYDYRPCFRYVRPLVEWADIAIGNLELTLPGKPPYTGYPMFRSPDALAEALKDAGFDVLVTANNHSNDARGAGVTTTIETLRRLNFMQTGTFKDANERAALYPLMLYKNGFKIALLNYTYGTNGIPTEAPTIVNLLDTVQIRKDLEEARARKPHFIIVVAHWGLEYQLSENPEQRAMAQFMIRHGADMIIGAHPHVVQPVKRETVDLPDGSSKEALVVYSLGNFISNQQKPHTDGGTLFAVELLHHKGVPRAECGRYGIIPVYRYIHKPDEGKATYYVVPDPLPADNAAGVPPPAAAAARQFADALRSRLKGCPVW